MLAAEEAVRVGYKPHCVAMVIEQKYLEVSIQVQFPFLSFFFSLRRSVGPNMVTQHYPTV